MSREPSFDLAQRHADVARAPAAPEAGTSGASVPQARVLRDLVAAAGAAEPLDALRRSAAEVAAVLRQTDVVVYARDDAGPRLVAGTWAFRRGTAPRGPEHERELARRATALDRAVHLPAAAVERVSGDTGAIALPARWRGAAAGAVVAVGPALSAGDLRVLLAFADAAGVLLGRARDEVAGAADARRAQVLDATLARSLEAAAAREPLARAGQLAAGAAHEMSGPLACLASNLRDLATSLAACAAGDGGSPEELLSTARDAVSDTQRLADVVRAFRELARPGLGARLRYDPASPLQDALRLFRAARRGCEVEARVEPPLPTVEGTPAGLAHVLLNLLDNGADASGGKGPLRVEACAAEGALVLRVSDAGCGIPSEIRDRVFEPWVTAKPGGRGTGLGLWLCRDIVEGHGGRISFESGERGTTFEVRIPGIPPL